MFLDKLYKIKYVFSFILLIAWLINIPLYGLSYLGPSKDFFKIDRVDIVGIKKVEKEAILERINSKSGITLTNYLLRDDIRKIYDMKYFESVEASQLVEGGKNILVFKVLEKPIISKIKFDGNDDQTSEDLLGQVKSKEFSILDINTIKQDLVALQKFYEDKGFFLASISYKLKEVDKENQELTFFIEENDKVRVKQVTFLGNKAFNDRQLKDIMMTKEEHFFSFMSDDGNFREYNFQGDIEKLKYFYKMKGYLQVNFGTPEITISEDKRWVFITLKVTEGPQFSVNKISFVGETLFSDKEMLKVMNLKEDDTYSEESLRVDILKLTEMYQDKGYAFANVLRTLNIVPGENRVDIEFNFEKGNIAKFGKITIRGNSKSRDKVVRRELQIEEGEQFSGSKLRRSKENVNRLGFFEPGSVIFNTVTSRDKDDVLDVDIEVKERNTGQITLGAGYSTASGAFIQSSISQNNFNGLGQTLSFSLNLSKDSKTYSVDFTEPYLFDTKWTAGAGVSKTTNSESSSYSYESKGFNLRVGYPIFDYTKLFLTYKLDDVNIMSLKDPTLTESVEEGLTSSGTVSVVRDTRNNVFEPTAGYYLKGSFELAGLGGDKEWYRSELDSRYFYNVWKDLVFRSRLFVGQLSMVDGQEIPRFRKYQLGGSRNLRGYGIEEIGPRNTITVDGENITFNERGLSSLYSSFEFEHPLAREAGLKWVLFFDAGNVWRDTLGDETFSLYTDYGFGLRWFSPIGVLRFEFGYPLGDRTDDNGMKFHFDIGQLF